MSGNGSFKIIPPGEIRACPSCGKQFTTNAGWYKHVSHKVCENPKPRPFYLTGSGFSSIAITKKVTLTMHVGEFLGRFDEWWRASAFDSRSQAVRFLMYCAVMGHELNPRRFPGRDRPNPKSNQARR